MSYRIPSQQQRFESIVKRSRFITTVMSVKNRSEAKDFLQALRAEFPDANHHCWAHILNAPNDIYGQDQSDDGEPKGTAGKSMLNVLQHAELGHIMVVVSRYFGGIKLGAGGLVRAYSNAVSDALKQIETVEYLLKKEMIIHLPYSLLDTLTHRLSNTRINITEKNYSESICLTVEYPVLDRLKLIAILEKIGQGSFTYSDSE